MFFFHLIINLIVKQTKQCNVCLAYVCALIKHVEVILFILK